MRLIDADEFEDALENTEYDISPAYEPDGYSHKLICEVLEETPTVDAVPVVRCRDCEHLVNAAVNANGFLICGVSDMEVAPEDFCSHGERRKSNENHT